MSSEFEAQIIKLAKKYKSKSSDSAATQSGTVPILNPVLKEFQSVSQKGADIFNKAQNSEALKVFELQSEFLEIFLGIPGRSAGLTIVSRTKIAILFDEEPNLITVIGKMRNNKSGIRGDLNKSLKLIQLSCSESDNGFEYKDNTGSSLSCEQAVAVILGWLVS